MLMTTSPTPTNYFPRNTQALPEANRSSLFDLKGKDVFDLRITPATKRIGDKTVRMLGYNGSIPGPTLRVKQGSELLVNVTNEGDTAATVHWHGLRLDNSFDGTTETQRPIQVGGSFSYRLTFPDAGLYWYHPHIREDYDQEMGLYGNIIVIPSEPNYWPPVNREITLTLDDVLLDDVGIAPFSRTEPNYVAMGRFGNVFLVNGEENPKLNATAGEVVRLYLTNTANTRVFNIAVPGGRMKLVGGDSGRYEHEQFVESVLLAPSERAVVDVLFDQPGQLTLEHRTPSRTHALAAIAVVHGAAAPSVSAQFGILRTNWDLASERIRVAPWSQSEPEKTLAFVAEMDMVGPETAEGAAAATYICPMHPDVVAHEPGRCPKCGMKLLPAQHAHETSGHDHDATSNHSMQGEHQHAHATTTEVSKTDGIEWEDDMVEVNRLTTPSNMRWKLIDRSTGKEGAAIDWQFRVGDRVKIRLVNEMDSDHPMHHPFHIHGAGRFLVLSRDGVAEPDLVWKDTVLVSKGEKVDILLEVTNPGVWMAHCHIAEHHEGGMMFNFSVES
jgi:FtsP/CotA-like multicopper oxidase with cupredoxin domain